MKWIGALIVISMTTIIGFEKSNQFNKRPRHIRQLKNALQILEAEIIYSQSSLREAFNTISKQIPTPLNLFFQNLEGDMERDDFELNHAWTVGVNQLLVDSSLGKNEAEILKQFGRTLGQHDFIQQQKHIKLTLHHLERELEESRAEQLKYSKLSKSLGILSGLFIVLLLI